MSKKIYISPIMTSDYYQLQTEMICCSPSCSCGCDGDGGFGCECDGIGGIIDDDMNGDTHARARGGYYDAPVQQAEFGNLW